MRKLISIPYRHLSTKKSNTSRYIQKQATDEYAAKAREHNFRARSAFKLLEIDEKFKFLKKDSIVLDVGCAPGSWLQVVTSKCTSGFVLGVDLQNVLPVKGAKILSLSDVTDKKTQERIREQLAGRQLDVILSDMAPNPTGDNATDHVRLINLCESVFNLFSNESDEGIRLSEKGVFLCKIWDGSYRSNFVNELSSKFHLVKTIKPVACRDNSAELYLFCRNFRK